MPILKVSWPKLNWVSTALGNPTQSEAFFTNSPPNTFVLELVVASLATLMPNVYFLTSWDLILRRFTIHTDKRHPLLQLIVISME
jgi:hypothetical protein